VTPNEQPAIALLFPDKLVRQPARAQATEHGVRRVGYDGVRKRGATGRTDQDTLDGYLTGCSDTG
jgi:hypothetical protein